MARSRKTFGKKLEKSKAKTFVGRKTQIDEFQQNVKLDPYEDEEYKNIFSIHGQGGVGKSTLLNKLLSICESEDYLTAFIDSENKDIFEVLKAMNAIAEQYGRKGFEFKKFNKKYEVYLKEKGQLEADPEKPKGTLGKLVKAGIKTGAKIGAEFVPGGNIVQEYIPINTFSEMSEEWINFVAKKITNTDEVELILSPLKVLTPLWIEGLFDLPEKKNIALFLDTFEASNPELEQWLISLLKERFGEIPSILLVVSGRNPLDIEKWSHFESILSRLELEPFTDEEAIAYLNLKGITNTEAIDTILAISGNLPVYLSLLSESDTGTPYSINDPNERIVERFLKHVVDPIKRKLSICASLPSQINQDIIECLLPEEEKAKAELYFNWLKERPFTEKRGGHWAYHPIVRDTMLRYLKETSEKEWDEWHERLAKWYADKAKKREIDENREEWFEDENWRLLLFEQYFHLLCINYKKYISATIQDFVYIMIEYNTSQTVPLVNTMIKVEETYKNQYNWGIVLENGVNSLLTESLERKEEILLMIKKINESEFIKNIETVSNLYIVEGLFESELEKTIEGCQKAIDIKPDNHYAFYYMGDVYYQKGEQDKAIEYYQKAIDIKSDYHEAFYYMGDVYYRKGELNKVIECYQKAIDIKPDYHYAFDSMGYVYYQKGEQDKAIEYYQKAIDIKPDYHYAFDKMGDAYKKKGELDKAIECYQKAIDIKPDYHYAFDSMGYVYYQKGELDKAIECYQKAIDIKPDYHYAFDKMGDAYRKKGELDKAIECYQKALDIRPDYHYAFDSMGYVYYQKGELDKAIECYQKAIDIKPDYHYAFDKMGIAYDEQGELDKAIECYQKALDIRSDYHYAFDSMGYVYYQKGELDKAIEYYQKALDIKPDDHYAFNGLGNAYDNKGKLDKAIECYQKALVIKPDYHEAFYNMGNAYDNKGKLDKAIECYQKALVIKPDYHEAFYNMGNAYGEKGEQDKAIECYQKALVIKPDYHEAYNNMGIAYDEQGEQDKAIECYQKALVIKPDNHEAIHSIGWISLKKWNFQKAEEYLLKVWEQSEHRYGHAAMNLGHVYLLQKNRKRALEWYKKSLLLWDDVTIFFNGMASDYSDLRMEEKGLSKEYYEELVSELRIFLTDMV